MCTETVSSRIFQYSRFRNVIKSDTFAQIVLNILKEYVIIALCFYHKKYFGRTWPEIKEIIGDDKLKSIKYGLRDQNLETFIKYLQDKTGERFSLEELEDGINGRDA